MVELEGQREDITLTDGSVLLRPYRSTDVDRLYEAVRESLVELSVWLPWCHAGYCTEESRSWIEARADEWDKGIEYDFTMIDAKDGTFLGGCGLNQINLTIAFGNLGYWVRTSRTGKGVATAAARLLAHFGFDRFKLRQIDIVAAVGNKASQRVAEKLGAIRQDTLPDRLVVRDKVYDGVVFSLFPQDPAIG